MALHCHFIFKRIRCTFLFYSTFLFCLSLYGRNITSTSIIVATINVRVPTTSDSLNHWNNRKELVSTFVQQHQYDVVCMQEVSAGQLKYLSKELVEYDYVGNENKIVGGEEYLPIFFRKDFFSCVEKGTFWLSDTPDVPGSKGWGGRHVRRATWIKLKCLKDGSVFCVINTHLDHVSIEANQRGMELIKHRMKNIAAEVPLVLCGDMNCVTTSKTYYEALNNEFLMYDAYQVAKQRMGVFYSYHAFGKTEVSRRSMIDFIFVTNQFDVLKVDIPKEYQSKGVYLTDHCPVIATLGY